MVGIPQANEAAPYYFTYINRVTDGDILNVLETQLENTIAFLRGISEEKSLHRYAPGKWSIRECVSHVNDTERAFQFRALWFARNFDSPLPSFDQNISVAAAQADRLPLSTHIEDFRAVRVSSLSLFQNLPDEAWMRTGTASGNPFSVRALAYIVAGHTAHHNAIVRERYL
jgi:hypothetical protein